MKEPRGCFIDENIVGDRSKTTHDPVDESKGKANVGECNSEVGPTGMIKGFGKINF